MFGQLFKSGELHPLPPGTDYRTIRGWLNGLLALCRRNQLISGYGFKVEVNPTGTSIAATGKNSFWIKLTSGGGGSGPKYSWTAEKDAPGGGFADINATGTTAVDPAYEINGNSAITSFPYYVRAWRGDVTGEVRFRAAAC